MKQQIENNFKFLTVLLLTTIVIFTGWIAINIESVVDYSQRWKQNVIVTDVDS